MERLISCEFNMDTACVELKFVDGSMISIDTIAVENEVVDNMYQRSELDWLIYNRPLEYSLCPPFLIFCFDIFAAFDSGISGLLCIFWDNPAASCLLCAGDAVLATENTHTTRRNPPFLRHLKS